MALMFINGESVPSKSGQTYEVKNPGTGEVVDVAGPALGLLSHELGGRQK